MIITLNTVLFANTFSLKSPCRKALIEVLGGSSLLMSE